MKHGLGSFLMVGEVAKKLGIARITVTRWCESGKIPAIPKAYGSKTTYMISAQVVELLLKEQEEAQQLQQKTPEKPHVVLLRPWKNAMAKGLITGRPFSPLTIDYYLFYVEGFLARHATLSDQAFKAELMKLPAHQFGKRSKFYKAVVCFAKYLVREGQLDSAFLEEVKPLFPKRHLPPKRLSVDENQLEELLSVAKTSQERLMFLLLAGTGLRVSEAVALRWDAVDFDKQMLTVRLGKGNKTRALGLSPALVSAMAEQQEANQSAWVFSNEVGKPLSRTAFYHRLKKLGKRAGVKVSPHALRRAFVTLNANKGRPLQMLQMACGHSDIKTTMSYCRTSEQEVIEAMKGWV